MMTKLQELSKQCVEEIVEDWKVLKAELDKIEKEWEEERKRIAAEQEKRKAEAEKKHQEWLKE